MWFCFCSAICSQSPNDSSKILLLLYYIPLPPPTDFHNFFFPRCCCSTSFSPLFFRWQISRFWEKFQIYSRYSIVLRCHTNYRTNKQTKNIKKKHDTNDNGKWRNFADSKKTENFGRRASTKLRSHVIFVTRFFDFIFLFTLIVCNRIMAEYEFAWRIFSHPQPHTPTHCSSIRLYRSSTHFFLPNSFSMQNTSAQHTMWCTTYYIPYTINCIIIADGNSFNFVFVLYFVGGGRLCT